MYNLQHPYVDNMDVSYNINIPGASSMTIVFDPLSCTEAVRGGAFAAHSATLLRPCDVLPELAYSVVKLLILCILCPLVLMTCVRSCRPTTGWSSMTPRPARTCSVCGTTVDETAVTGTTPALAPPRRLLSRIVTRWSWCSTLTAATSTGVSSECVCLCLRSRVLKEVPWLCRCGYGRGCGHTPARVALSGALMHIV